MNVLVEMLKWNQVLLSHYATKEVTGADTSNFAKKVNLASLKSVVDKLDINELVIAQTV